MSESPNPYQSAVSSDAEPMRRKPYSISAVSRPWAILAVLLLVARWFMLPIFAEFNTPLPLLTQWMVGLYTPLAFFAVGIVFVGIAALFNSESARRRIGFISLLLTLPMLLIAAVGLLLPLVRGIKHLGV